MIYGSSEKPIIFRCQVPEHTKDAAYSDFFSYNKQISCLMLEWLWWNEIKLRKFYSHLMMFVCNYNKNLNGSKDVCFQVGIEPKEEAWSLVSLFSTRSI